MCTLATMIEIVLSTWKITWVKTSEYPPENVETTFWGEREKKSKTQSYLVDRLIKVRSNPIAKYVCPGWAKSKTVNYSTTSPRLEDGSVSTTAYSSSRRSAIFAVPKTLSKFIATSSRDDPEGLKPQYRLTLTHLIPWSVFRPRKDIRPADGVPNTRDNSVREPCNRAKSTILLLSRSADPSRLPTNLRSQKWKIPSIRMTTR